MDPFTLFALASGAVNAVKKGCELYKEIKGVAGDVKEIIGDLDKQFHKKYEGRPVPAAAVKQLNEEKARIRELNAKDPDDVYAELGDQLGTYYENYAKCIAIFEEEERRAQQVYEGETSLGKRALQRVLMKSKLEKMGVELREVMVYQAPPELGDLYTRVNDMMGQMLDEQKKAVAKKAEEDKIKRKASQRRWHSITLWTVGGLAFIVVSFCLALLFAWVAQDRAIKYPQYGNEIIPVGPTQRAYDALPKRYVGR